MASCRFRKEWKANCHSSNPKLVTGLRKKSQDWEQIKNLVTANLVTKSYKKLEKTEPLKIGVQLGVQLGVH